MGKDDVWLDIFDNFFGDNRKRYFNQKQQQDIPDDIMNIMDKMQELTDESMTQEEMDEIFEEELGKPIEITEYEEGNIHYVKKVWLRGDGKFVRVSANVKDGVEYEDLSLEEKLKIAIQNEDYEKAAELKNEIENQDFLDKVVDEEKEKTDEERVQELLKGRKKLIENEKVKKKKKKDDKKDDEKLDN